MLFMLQLILIVSVQGNYDDRLPVPEILSSTIISGSLMEIQWKNTGFHPDVIGYKVVVYQLMPKTVIKEKVIQGKNVIMPSNIPPLMTSKGHPKSMVTTKIVRGAYENTAQINIPFASDAIYEFTVSSFTETEESVPSLPVRLKLGEDNGENDIESRSEFEDISFVSRVRTDPPTTPPPTTTDIPWVMAYLK